MEIRNKAISCSVLLEEGTRRVSEAKKIAFLGVEGFDVYNISVPFFCGGEEYIAGRVEKREDELSFVRIFQKTAPFTYEAVLPNRVFQRLQDPFVTKIGGEFILGGVQIISDPLNDHRIICWRTLFYRGKTPSELRLFAEGPNKMKDIRLTELPGGRIGIFTRPQGGAGGLGKIGYLSVDCLEEVTAENILKAPIFDSHFLPDEWGGVNDIHVLNNGVLGVVGHIAYRSADSKLHYHPMAFQFDPERLTHTPVKILACRNDFPSGACKRPDLDDVLFTAGIRREPDGRTLLYTGLSDCEAGCAVIDSPF